MVLAAQVGRTRSFGLGLLLTIVTFGIYAVYWNYKAHNELYRQFELGREGRDEGMVWYVLGLVLPPFLLAYLWVFASNVNYLRARIGLVPRMTSARLVTLVGLGVGAFAVGIIVLQAALVVQGSEPTQAEVDAAIATTGPTFVALSILAIILLAVAYRGLQRDINELWAAYGSRMGYLAAHPEETRGPMRDGLLPVPEAGAFAAPLRHETEALRLRHPDLLALATLDELVPRAEAGDADARQQGEQLLADVAALLQERAELLRQREEAPVDQGEAIAQRLEVVEGALFSRPDVNPPDS